MKKKIYKYLKFSMGWTILLFCMGIYMQIKSNFILALLPLIPIYVVYQYAFDKYYE